jgi:hypothetical protein
MDWRQDGVEVQRRDAVLEVTPDTGRAASVGVNRPARVTPGSLTNAPAAPINREGAQERRTSPCWHVLDDVQSGLAHLGCGCSDGCAPGSRHAGHEAFENAKQDWARLPRTHLQTLGLASVLPDRVSA